MRWKSSRAPWLTTGLASGSTPRPGSGIFRSRPSDRQLRTFLATAQQHRLFAFFHVAAYTGARRGEVLNLRWKDIDLDGKKITINGSTAVIGGERVNGTIKSGRTRVVSIDDETAAILRQRKADQAAEQLKAGDSWRGIKDGYVFTTGWGEPIYPDTVTSLMTKLIRANQGDRPGKPKNGNGQMRGWRAVHAGAGWFGLVAVR